jgi:hypothetical protein
MTTRRRLPMLPSASKSDLAAVCVFPWNGGVRWPKWEPERVDARFGKAFHAIGEAVANVFNEFGDVHGDVEMGVHWCAHAFEITEKERETLEAITHHLIEFLRNDDGVDGRIPEAVFAIDAETAAARRLTDRRDKSYSERVAIADLVVVFGDGRIVIREYKTGRGALAKKAATAAQTRLLALVAARYFDVNSIRTEIVHVGADGFLIDAAEFDSLELLGIECEQEQLLERLLAAPRPVPGPWCSGEFCPIKADCPATKAMLAAVEREALAVPVIHEPRSAEEAAKLRNAVQIVRAWADAADERWKSWASRMPLPVGGGKVVIAQERVGDEEIVENEKTVDVVNDELGQLVVGGDPATTKAAQHAAYTVKISKASIARGARKALGPAPARGALKRTQDRILNRLRSEGLVRRGSPYVVYTEVPENRLGAGAVDTEGMEVES